MPSEVAITIHIWTEKFAKLQAHARVLCTTPEAILEDAVDDYLDRLRTATESDASEDGSNQASEE